MTRTSRRPLRNKAQLMSPLLVSTPSSRRGRKYTHARCESSPQERYLERDVCIIGGGCAGTFSAIRLRDRGLSVALVEREDRLGGHAITYTDPPTGRKIEAGVVVYRPSTTTRDFFDRFGIKLRKFAPPDPHTTLSVDLKTGKKVRVPQQDPSGAFARYAAQLAKYPWLDDGFNLPDPVPDELLLPFGTFVKRHKLSAMVPLVFKIGQGLGDLLAQPTLYVMKNFGRTALQGFAQGFLVPVCEDNSALYAKAEAELCDNVLLNSSVLAVDRHGSHADITLDCSSRRTLVRARRLLIAMPPKLENLDGFDLDAEELALFSRFTNSAYWTVLLRGSGIQDGTQINNAESETAENLPHLPDIYEISPTGVSDLIQVKYGSPVMLSDAQVRKDVMASFARLRRAGIAAPGEPRVEYFANHNPFELTVSVADIKAGFYSKLNALCGRRNTYYTGAAFQAHDSSLIWEYSDGVVQAMLDDLSRNG